MVTFLNVHGVHQVARSCGPKKKSAWENGRSEHAPDPSRSKKAVIPFSQVETLNTEGTDSRDNECGEIEIWPRLELRKRNETFSDVPEDMWLTLAEFIDRAYGWLTEGDQSKCEL